MALTAASIKARLQASFGTAQDTIIQNISLSALSQALFNSFTVYPVLSPVTALPGNVVGTITVPSGTFLTAFLSSFPAAQDTGIQVTELTKLADGIEAVLNNDAQASYPLSPGGLVFAFTTTPPTQAQVLAELQAAFGTAQDNTIRDSVLSPMAAGLVTGMTAVVGTVSVSTGLGNIAATGVII